MPPHLAGLRIESCRADGGRVVIRALASAPGAACPRCGQVSRRVHSGYERCLADVPAGGRAVTVRLAVRRFFCGTPDCGAVTFTEQVEGLTSPYARRTPPLTAMLQAVALALAGRAGARLAAALGIAAPSRHTMIRLVLAVPEDGAAAPRVLGIDDFALRRGHAYGTVLIDIETGRPVDLLPDREAGTVEEWLKAHPGTAVICRDRAGAYAQAARAGAPDAVQVADRWHLLHNLGEKTREAAAEHRACCLAPAGGPRRQQQEREQPAAPAGRLPIAERTRQRHAEVSQLRDAGHSKAAIARILGLSVPTVARYAKAPAPGDITPAARDTALDPYKPALISRWNAGQRNAAALHAEIAAQGYTGSHQQVRRFVRPFRNLPAAPPAPPPVPSARKITTWLMTSPASLAPEDAAALAAVTAACPHLRQLQPAIRSFCDMMTGLTGTRHLSAWLDAAETSSLDQLASFARGIRRDHDAVLAGLSQPYSSGKVEGTVNKIKMLKRQMYGRASFELLRKLVLLA